jgi:hypothetical protein
MRLQAGVRSRAPRAGNERLRCVIVEHGSPRLSEAGAGAFDETIAIAQMQGELPVAFAARVLERIATIERAGRALESAVVLAGSSCEPAAKAARRSIVMKLSAHARARGELSQLTLARDTDAKPDSRAELLGLAEEVMVLPHADSLRVRVRFGAEARRASGVSLAAGGRR